MLSQSFWISTADELHENSFKKLNMNFYLLDLETISGFFLSLDSLSLVEMKRRRNNWNIVNFGTESVLIQYYWFGTTLESKSCLLVARRRSNWLGSSELLVLRATFDWILFSEKFGVIHWHHCHLLICQPHIERDTDNFNKRKNHYSKLSLMIIIGIIRARDKAISRRTVSTWSGGADRLNEAITSNRTTIEPIEFAVRATLFGLPEDSAVILAQWQLLNCGPDSDSLLINVILVNSIHVVHFALKWRIRFQALGLNLNLNDLNRIELFELFTVNSLHNATCRFVVLRTYE